jgi:hypothetical protein
LKVSSNGDPGVLLAAAHAETVRYGDPNNVKGVKLALAFPTLT